MPPRKSDPAPRKSDVSVSRFVLNDDEMQPESAAVPPPAAAAAAAASSADPGPTSPPPPAQATAQSSDKKDKEKDPITIEDLTLPKSIITRLAKGVLPPNTQIQANAILAMTKSASVFISHLANAANERATMANKKTILPQDVFNALDEIEFSFMRPQLEAEFAKYNTTQSTKRSTYRRKVAAAKKAATGEPGDDSVMSLNTTAMDDSMADGGPDAMPRAKKLKTAGDESQMDVDDEDGGHDASDAETMPDENEEEEEEEEDEDDDVVEEEQDDDDEDDQAEGEERDELEEREQNPDEDEALDGEDSE